MLGIGSIFKIYSNRFFNENTRTKRLKENRPQKKLSYPFIHYAGPAPRKSCFLVAWTRQNQIFYAKTFPHTKVVDFKFNAEY
jgi:hypothetical protein